MMKSALFETVPNELFIKVLAVFAKHFNVNKRPCSVNYFTQMSEHTTSVYFISDKLLIPKHQQI